MDLNGAQLRDRAIHLTRTGNPCKALALAREVSVPWNRCIILAWVARFAPADEVPKIAEEALMAARKSEDAYQRLAVLAWPLRALIEREQRGKAERLLRDALPQITHVTHPVSRADALFLLVQA